GRDSSERRRRRPPAAGSARDRRKEADLAVRLAGARPAPRPQGGLTALNSSAVTLDPETEERIDQPVSEEAERETRLTPTQAVAQMKINVPVRGNRKLRRILERVNADTQLKAWWHASNVNAVARMHINDHSWVHIQIVANIGLKLLRQLEKHHVQPSLVGDYGYENDDSEVVVLLAALTHCIGMAVHREGHEDFSLFLAEPKLRQLLEGVYDEPDLTVIVSEVLQAITS